MFILLLGSVVNLYFAIQMTNRFSAKIFSSLVGDCGSQSPVVLADMYCLISSPMTILLFLSGVESHFFVLDGPFARNVLVNPFLRVCDIACKIPAG